MGRAVQQAHGKHQVVLGTGDGPRQVLVLLVEAVEKSQLLLAVGGIVKCVDVQCQMCWRLLEGGDELVEQHVPQAEEAR